MTIRLGQIAIEEACLSNGASIMSKDYDVITIKVVNQLFKELMAICPAFQHAWPKEEDFINAKRQWMIAFKDEGINSIEQLKKGLQGVRSSTLPFVVSVGAFIALCKLTPEDIGAPPARDAYLESVNKYSGACDAGSEWSHPAVKYAAAAIGSSEIRSKTEKEILPIFEEVYLKGCNLIVSGRNMNQIENQDISNLSHRDCNAVNTYIRCLNEDLDPKDPLNYPSSDDCIRAEQLYFKLKGVRRD